MFKLGTTGIGLAKLRFWILCEQKKKKTGRMNWKVVLAYMHAMVSGFLVGAGCAAYFNFKVGLWVFIALWVWGIWSAVVRCEYESAFDKQ